MIGILSVFGAVGSIAYVNSPAITGSLAEVIVFWINFGVHLVLTLVWIISERTKCNGNYIGTANLVFAFGLIYIGLFIIDIATAIIMIVSGAYFIAVYVTTLAKTSKSLSDIDLQTTLLNAEKECSLILKLDKTNPCYDPDSAAFQAVVG